MRKRNNTVSVRLSDNELQAFNNLQEKTGLPKHALITKLVSGATLFPTEYTEELKKLLSVTYQLMQQTRKIGVNLNQIARACNSGNYDDLKDLNEINIKISKLLEVAKWLYSSVLIIKKR